MEMEQWIISTNQIKRETTNSIPSMYINDTSFNYITVVGKAYSIKTNAFQQIQNVEIIPLNE